MTLYSVYDNTTKEATTHYTLTAAKKHMRAIMAQGHEASGSKTKVYSNGDWVPCGEITLKGSNAFMVANTRQTKKGY